MSTRILKLGSMVFALAALVIGALYATWHAAAQQGPEPLAFGGQQTDASCTERNMASKETKTFFVSCGGFF